MYGILTIFVALTLGSEVQNVGKNETPGCDVLTGWEIRKMQSSNKYAWTMAIW